MTTNELALDLGKRVSADEARRRGSAAAYASDGSTVAQSRRAQAEPEAAAEDERDTDFNDEMVRIMTAAAELRAERARIRSGEDQRLAAAEAAAIENLIRAHARGATGRGRPIRF